MDLTTRLQQARIRALEAEVARLKRALSLSPAGVERGYLRAEVLRVIPERRLGRR